MSNEIESYGSVVDNLLRNVDYSFAGFLPSKETFAFFTFIQMVHNGELENENPLVHYKIIDNIFSSRKLKHAIMSHRGIAKKCKLTEPVITPNGLSTHGEIKVGDEVVNMLGTTSKVIAKSDITFENWYKFTFSDGTVIDFGEDHNHIIYTRKGRKKEDSYKVMTTKELYESELTYNIKERKSSRDPKAQYRFKVPLTKPVAFKRKEQKIDPYVFGYGLANGSFGKGEISCHNDDSVEIANYFIERGFNVHSFTTILGTLASRFRCNHTNIFKEYETLRSGNKYIPDNYLYGSISQRVDLLRGLMDGDGSIAKNGNVTYSTTSERLANDVANLARSLGALATVTKYDRDDRDSDSFVVRIRIKDFNPFLLKRKAKKWKPCKNKTKSIVSIEKLDIVEPGCCIVLDSDDKSYLTTNFTVTHNSTLMGAYLPLYIATTGKLPGFGKVNYAIYVADSMENNVRTTMNTIRDIYDSSEFLKSKFESVRFTDTRVTMIRKQVEGENKTIPERRFYMSGYGASALSLDTKLITKDGYITMKDCKVGDKIIAPDGSETTIQVKSEIFNRPMYEIVLADGRTLKVCEEHINSVVFAKTRGKYVKEDILTKDLLKKPLYRVRNRTKNGKDYVSKEALVYIENISPVQYDKKDFLLDPYTLGLLLGDGSFKKTGSVELCGTKEDIDNYIKNIPYKIGFYNHDKRTENTYNIGILNIFNEINALGLRNTRSKTKFIPEEYFFSSIEQRFDLLAGILDTDGTSSGGRISFVSISKQLAYDVIRLVNSLGGSCTIRENEPSKAISYAHGHQIISREKSYKVEIWIRDYMKCFKLERKLKNIEFNFTKKRWMKKANLNAITAINRIEDEPSQCIGVNHDLHQFVVNDFVRTHNTGVRGPLALDEILYTNNGYVTMADVKTGDYVFTPKGTHTKVLGKSEVFYDDMYELEYKDGRKLKVNHSHLNVVYYKKHRKAKHQKLIIKTTDLYEMFRDGKLLYTKYTKPVKYVKKDFALDPYLLGVALGDGHMPYSKGLKISGLKGDCEFYYEKLKDKYEISKHYFDERSGVNMLRLSFHGLTNILKELGLAGKTGKDKFIPEQYLFGSIEQRKELLAGLLDTDGSCYKDKRCNSSKTEFSNISKNLAKGVCELARSLGYRAIFKVQKRKEPRKTLYRVIITSYENPFRLTRKANLYIKPRDNKYEKLISVKKIEKEPSQCILVEDNEHEFLTTGYLPTHNTRKGLDRPQIAIIDDLIKSNADARSDAILRSIRDTVFSDVEHALHPTRRRIIWLGTPFNQNDPLYQAIESGSWTASVYPVCEEIRPDLKKEEFRGSWEDRFTYEAVMESYKDAMRDGSIDEFMQEMMLRITSDENRLIDVDKIPWFRRSDVLRNLAGYNIYITTDLATSKEKTSDPAVIMIWAINAQGDYLLIDGQAKRGDPSEHINDLFDYCVRYKPLSVGIEISGQQAAFVSMLRDKMVRENRFFHIFEQTPGKPGIRPASNINKYTRFLGVLHLYSNGKIWLPEELKNSEFIQEYLNQLRGVTKTNTGKRIGSARHDDILDCSAQLQFLNIVKPSVSAGNKKHIESNLWIIDDEDDEYLGSPYIF